MEDDLNQSSKIFNGARISSSTFNSQYPFVVQTEDRLGYFCTGTYVGNRRVITAYHCDPGDITSIRYGSITQGRGTRVGVQTFRAPSNADSSVNDIVLLILDRDLPIKAAKISGVNSNTKISVGQRGDALGWGRVGPIRNNDCSGNPSGHDITLVRPTYARNNRIMEVNCVNCGSCPGDSGSPLLRGDVVTGILSYGTYRGNNDFAGYADPLRQTSWLKNNL